MAVIVVANAVVLVGFAIFFGYLMMRKSGRRERGFEVIAEGGQKVVAGDKREER